MVKPAVNNIRVVDCEHKAAERNGKYKKNH